MTNAASYPPALESILSLLRSNQDERKLAGLLLVTKVIVGQDWSVEILSLLADAVGSTFLRRLLRSTDNEGVYVDLAINVISALITSPDVAKRFARDGLCTDIMAVQKGPLTSDLLATYTSFINAGDLTPFSLMSSIWQNDNQRDLMKSVVNSWIRPEYAQQILFSKRDNIMAVLGEDLKSRQDLRKFEALELIVSILSQLHPFSDLPVDAYDCLGNGGIGSWSTAIRDGLVQILSSRVNAQQRRLALLASWFLLDLFGYSWASTGEPINARFPTLLITTVAVESRLLLEYYAEHPTINEDIETLRACFVIANIAIMFLVEDDATFDQCKRNSEFHWSLLPPDSLMLIHSRLSETIRTLFDFLVECESQQRYRDPIMPHICRVLGTWVSEDSESFQSDLETSCAFLVKVCQESKDPFNPFVYLVPAFARLSINLQGAERLVESGLLDQLSRLISLISERVGDSVALMAGDVCHILINIIECIPSITSEPALQKIMPYLPSIFDNLWSSRENLVPCLQTVCVLLAVGCDSLTPSVIDRDAEDIWPKVASLLFDYTVDDQDLQDLRRVTMKHLTSCMPRFRMLSDALRSSDSVPESIQKLP